MWLYSFDRGSARGHVRAWYERARSRSPAPPGQYRLSLYCRRWLFNESRRTVPGTEAGPGEEGPGGGHGGRRPPDVGGAVADRSTVATEDQVPLAKFSVRPIISSAFRET